MRELLFLAIVGAVAYSWYQGRTLPTTDWHLWDDADMCGNIRYRLLEIVPNPSIMDSNTWTCYHTDFSGSVSWYRVGYIESGNTYKWLVAEVNGAARTITFRDYVG